MRKAWIVHHWVLQSPIVFHSERDAINLMESLNQPSGESGGRPGYVEEVEVDNSENILARPNVGGT